MRNVEVARPPNKPEAKHVVYHRAAASSTEWAQHRAQPCKTQQLLPARKPDYVIITTPEAEHWKATKMAHITQSLDHQANPKGILKTLRPSHFRSPTTVV
jgi:hypothetical protein